MFTLGVEVSDRGGEVRKVSAEFEVGDKEEK